FGKERRFPSERMPCGGGSFDPRADRAVAHLPLPIIRSANEPNGHEPEDGAVKDGLGEAHAANQHRLVVNPARQCPGNGRPSKTGRGLGRATWLELSLSKNCLPLPSMPTERGWNTTPTGMPLSGAIRVRCGEGCSRGSFCGWKTGKPPS